MSAAEIANPKLLHVPASPVRFKRAQLRDYFNVPDWHPEGHPAMPGIVAHGRAPDVYACGFCHLPNGLGRPENSGIAGLPVRYILEQLKDFADGKRQSAEPLHKPTEYMIKIAGAVSDAEARTAAEYFAQLKPRRWIRVVESATVPRTRVAGWMLVPVKGAAREPIGERIIEIAEDLERTELRDDASGFVAYVPPGSIARGKALANSGGAGDVMPCVACHGPLLQGMGTAPRLAGRSPSYLVRQIFEIQHGLRRGDAVLPMKIGIANLKLDDMVAVVAYAASLNP